MRLDSNGVRHVAGAFLLLAAILASGCTRDDTPRRVPDDRLRNVLQQAPDTGFVLSLAAGDTFHVSAQTVAFYRHIRYRPAWLKGDEPGERADALFGAIARADEDGLDPARYGYALAQRIVATLEHEPEDDESRLDDNTRSDYLADLDLVLSEGFMRYADDIVGGAISSDEVGKAWRIPRHEVPNENVLQAILQDGDPQQIIQRLRPTTPYYQRLMAALQRMREIRDSGGWITLPDDITIAEGDTSTAVALLRQRLRGSDDAREATLATRGDATPTVFDRDLRDALRHYQTRHAIDDDGRLGTQTLRELNSPIGDRIAELALNLDRWRWLPRELGDFFIIVNIAGFELEVVEHDRAIEAMNVVVGKPGWNTPVFADSLEHVVINPYWTPTESIVEEEILPAIERDASYLERNGFERTSDGGFRQRPGPHNALGKYKFLFPNRYDIYLHDTPADHLFSRARRDFSHGCIRVERPADLARLLLSRAGHSGAEIDAMVKTQAEKWVPLKQPVPIYIVYFTTWVKEDGTVRYHHDVYGHDEELQTQTAEMKPDSAAGQRSLTLSAGG